MFRLHTSHSRFTLGFTVSLFAISNALNIEKLAKWFRDSDGVDYSALCAFLLAGLCLFTVFFALLAFFTVTVLLLRL